MDLDRIKRLEDSVLALQLENSPRQIDTDSDVIARLTNLEASVLQEKAMKGEFKRKLKFANSQNSRLILRLKKEKARNALFNYRMRAAKLPSTPEDKVYINSQLPEDNRISKSMNDIPMSTYGNQGRQVTDLSDSQSFTDEDSIPTFNPQIPPYRLRNKDEDRRHSSTDLKITEATPVQRIGVRMNGEQALQLLPSYQRTIQQQQQEIRELCLRIKAMETKYSVLVRTTQDGKQLQEYLNVISDKENQADSLKQRVRDLQIGIIELENEKNDAIDLARDLSLQLTRAKLAKDTALRTSRQLMEQFPTRPPRDRTPDSSIPSTPVQTDLPLLPYPVTPVTPLTPVTPDQSRYLPQPPGKSSRPKVPMTVPMENSTPMTSQSYETGSLPRSVQFFKKSVKDQNQSDTLPSKIIIKNSISNKPIKMTNERLTTNHFPNKDSPGADRLSPLQETSPTKTDSFRLRSDSSPELAVEKTFQVPSDNPTELIQASKHKEKESSTNDDSMGRRTISMSLLASGLGLKSKNKEKLKKVRTVEDPIKTNSNTKIHKRFSSLNSLPNAFKRSSKSEDKDKRKQEYTVPPISNKQQKGARLSEGTLEIEFKHLTENASESNNNLRSPNISIDRPSEKYKMPNRSLPISDLSEHTEETKRLKEMNNIPNSQIVVNRSTLQLEQ